MNHPLHRVKKFILILLCLLMVLPLTAPARAQEELTLASQGAVLMDADSGTVLYEKNMHQVLYPASITKLLTAMLALEHLQPEDVLTVSRSALDAVPITSSHISLQAGERITVEQALYALGLASANDAANVLAETVAGSLEAFAQLMTRTAEELGAKNSHFTNANGLPDQNHYTTAYDMALITAAAWKQEGLAKYFSTVSYTLPATNCSAARVLSNKDRLLEGGQYYYSGVQMAKTGWTTAAQGTFAAVVQQADTTLVAVTLKSPLLEDKYQDTHKLMDYGFTHYTRIFVTGQTASEGAQLGAFRVAQRQRLSYLIAAEEDPGDICFTWEALDYAHMRANRLSVTVQAELNGRQLPAATLLLEREPEPRVAYTLSELLQRQVLSLDQLPPAVRVLAAFALAVLIVLLFVWLRRQVRRHNRRRHLKNRIRRMKKKME